MLALFPFYALLMGAIFFYLGDNMYMIDIPEQALIDAVSIMLLMAILVTIDTILAWVIIANRYNQENDIPCTLWNTFRAIFFKAWHEGYLESHIYRKNLGAKIEGYGVTIIVAIAVFLLPDYKYNGIQIDETLAMMFYISIVLSETFSIAENLKKLGVNHIGIIERAIKAVVRKLGIDTTEGDKK